MLCPNCHSPIIRVRSQPLEDEYRCINNKCKYSLVVYTYGKKTYNTEDLSSSPTQCCKSTDG